MKVIFCPLIDPKLIQNVALFLMCNGQLIGNTLFILSLCGDFILQFFLLKGAHFRKQFSENSESVNHDMRTQGFPVQKGSLLEPEKER